MTRDPLTIWNGPFPYDLLAAVGVTPASSMKEVVEASFDLMAEGLMTPEARHAWDELRSVERRLFLDFFLYPLEAQSGPSDPILDCMQPESFVQFDQ